MSCVQSVSYDPLQAFPFAQACSFPRVCSFFLSDFTETRALHLCILHLCACVLVRLCLGVAMSSGDHVIWPRPSGRTIAECVCVLAAGSVTTRVRGVGMITEGVQKYYPGYCIPYVRQDELESFPLLRKTTNSN